MCIIEALSEILGNDPSQMIPGLSTFKYRNDAFIHVQDLNPTVGREHTYRDLADTLRGIGEYMTEYNSFWTSEFQVWDVSSTKQVKIGSGGVGGSMRLQATDAVTTGVPVQSQIPACDRGNSHCVA